MGGQRLRPSTSPKGVLIDHLSSGPSCCPQSLSFVKTKGQVSSGLPGLAADLACDDSCCIYDVEGNTVSIN